MTMVHCPSVLWFVAKVRLSFVSFEVKNAALPLLRSCCRLLRYSHRQRRLDPVIDWVAWTMMVLKCHSETARLEDRVVLKKI